MCYLRTFVDSICCASFIMGKSRVAPVKPLSTPRMELSAAVIAVRLARFVLRELDVSFDRTVFWSDSTTVLGYLHNTSKRRPVFETNRIKLIRELSTVDQWRWIDTRRNPADLYFWFWFTPSLPWDGGLAQTAIQDYAINLITLG